MKRFCVASLIVFLPFFLFAQSRKEIREAGIQTITEYKSDFKTGKEKKIKIAETTYDKNGNEIEVKEWDDFGKLQKHEKYTYNSNNDKTTITEYDASGKVKKTTTITYNDNHDKVSVVECDASGKVKKTTKYQYFGKYKISKEVYDENNKLISKKTYEYTRYEKP